EMTTEPPGSIATLTGFDSSPVPRGPSIVPSTAPPATVVTATFERKTMLSGAGAPASMPSGGGVGQETPPAPEAPAVAPPAVPDSPAPASPPRPDAPPPEEPPSGVPPLEEPAFPPTPPAPEVPPPATPPAPDAPAPAVP